MSRLMRLRRSHLNMTLARYLIIRAIKWQIRLQGFISYRHEGLSELLVRISQMVVDLAQNTPIWIYTSTANGDKFTILDADIVLKAYER